ncbi:hypothetical protein MGAST_00495 [Mycobacterium gastri 'Wayne']|uniref:Uncharacterized protein n=1 Tax=Mycobacterium gastri TaxID=1777 RepID=A0A1X1VMC9_MYCGS|nr:hypothetical protein MGAST_00495 [Mycobacterium gastri 'Wayne']ORV70217.1 hypothetical protein AWC07_05505 [Mycobacterium gastri]
MRAAVTSTTDQQAQRADDHATLASVDLLADVISASGPADGVGGFERLLTRVRTSLRVVGREL